MKTGFVFHEKYLWHDTGNHWLTLPGPARQPLAHPEDPETKRRLVNLLHVTDLWDELTELKPRMASREEILRVHTEAHLDHIAALSAEWGGEAGIDAPMGRGSYEIALLSAGGVVTAVDAVMEGRVDNAYALVRPPGHHALADRAYGFCLFANIAIAIRHAFATYPLKRIAVVDWDVHHGNGTEAAFYNEAEVLTISIHQDGSFPPDSGYIADNGAGEGEGYNLNIPLPPGSGHGAYLATFERLVVPALRRYQPDLIIIANGLDANKFDPLGRMMAWSETYRLMTRMMLAVAAECCQGRLVVSHEGGYSASYVPYCGLAIIEELCGTANIAPDPYGVLEQGSGPQALQPHQEAVIRSVEPLLEKIAAG